MEEFGYLNLDKLHGLFAKLTSTEFNLLVMMLFYMSSKNRNIYINNAESREYLASMDFKRTPERISILLSSLVNKGVIKREGQGVYTVIDNLYVKAKKASE